MDDNNQIHSGIDIIEIARIKNVLTKHPKRFLEKSLLNMKEIIAEEDPHN